MGLLLPVVLHLAFVSLLLDEGESVVWLLLLRVELLPLLTHSLLGVENFEIFTLMISLWLSSGASFIRRGLLVFW